MSDTSQKTSYGKSKQVSTSKLEGMQAHIKTAPGPTGSSRAYPKSSGSPHNTDFNPQKHKGSTYAVNGV